MENAQNVNQKDAILVVGACGLDRLLMVREYPQPDAKIRAKSYKEVGGGNAANSAHAMALLLSPTSSIIRLATKVGQDSLGKQVLKELADVGVDTTFCVTVPDTQTGFTTIIVEQPENNDSSSNGKNKKHPTRTCIHTQGSCGELSISDLEQWDMDRVFDNVIHFHSDGRHTEASLYLAQQARERNISISADVEKDRNSPALDQMLPMTNILFTNAQQIEGYLQRLQKEKIHEQQENHDVEVELLQPNVVALDDTTKSIADFLVHVLQPSFFFTRWYPDVVKHKEVVITKGHFGAVHILCETIVMEAMDQECPNTITLSSCPSADQDKSGIFRAVHEYSHVQHVAKAPKGAEMSPKSTQQFMKVSATYRLTLMGISKDLDANAEVMDPTGAGDSFLAGYLASLHDSLEDTLFSWDADKLQNQDSKTKSRLQFAAWVAGRKLGGVGARTALPTRQDVIDRLGHNPLHIQENVSRLVGNFDLDAISQKPQIL